MYTYIQILTLGQVRVSAVYLLLVSTVPDGYIQTRSTQVALVELWWYIIRQKLVVTGEWCVRKKTMRLGWGGDRRRWANTGTHFHTCVQFVKEQNVLINGTLRISLHIVYRTRQDLCESLAGVAEPERERDRGWGQAGWLDQESLRARFIRATALNWDVILKDIGSQLQVPTHTPCVHIHTWTHTQVCSHVHTTHTDTWKKNLISLAT